MKWSRWMPLAGIVLSCIAPWAAADTVDLTFNTVSPYRQMTVTVDNGSHWETVWAGLMQWTRTGGAAIGNPDNTLQTFCIEFTQNVYFGGHYTYNLVPLEDAPNSAPMGADKALQLSELWGQHYADIADANSGAYADKAAAFQLAVWDIVYDDGASVLSGPVRIAPFTGPAPAWATIANQWLSSLTVNGPLATLGGISHPTIQDQLYLDTSQPQHVPVPVPLPASVWGGLVLMGALVGARVRRWSTTG